VVKFPDKDRHQIYLEPEGRDTDEIYCNGLPTSLPQDLQYEIVHRIKGLENAEFIRLGYAIEYDCAPPTQLRHSLETKTLKNLFFAGQINCTSGYEEAAAQGLMAGINILCKLKGRDAFVLDRSEAYIGVLIDDLVTRGTTEPYRMFTSRAEFRLLLRQDNADERLMKYGYEFGLVAKDTYDLTNEKIIRIKNKIKKLKTTRLNGQSLYQILKRPDVKYKTLQCKELCEDQINDEEILRVETEIKYEGYIARQRIDVDKFKKSEKKKIPNNLDYNNVKGMSREAKEKLIKIQPDSIAQAARIPGVSPCDISILAIYMESEYASK